MNLGTISKARVSKCYQHLTWECHFGIESKTIHRFHMVLDYCFEFTVCGPSDGNEVKDVFGRPGAYVGVDSTRKRPIAAHGVDARWQV